MASNINVISFVSLPVAHSVVAVYTSYCIYAVMLEESCALSNLTNQLVT